MSQHRLLGCCHSRTLPAFAPPRVIQQHLNGVQGSSLPFLCLPFLGRGCEYKVGGLESISAQMGDHHPEVLSDLS